MTPRACPILFARVKVEDEIPEMTPRDAFIRVEAERIH